jgi:uroporphyrin-III C-methyltransferase/precorrin-2 dehydrogenase/sirohydrochlorin ferrochelatase
VTFVTAQEKPGGISPDWKRLAAPNHTLAIYMGADRAELTAGKLIAAGRSPETPVAIVENGSRPDERVITGSLGELGGLVARAGLTGPALLFVGECAAFSAAQLDVRAELVA